ncbi:MAG: hypothetical protein IJ887_13655 [Prevotella sp.]|nr:hypothetical protein [Prevotella sp.]
MATPIKIIPTLHGESARRFIERAEEVERIDMDIDEDDPWLYEEHEELSPLPGNKEHYTLEELREILINDLDEAYAV